MYGTLRSDLVDRAFEEGMRRVNLCDLRSRGDAGVADSKEVDFESEGKVCDLA